MPIKQKITVERRILKCVHEKKLSVTRKLDNVRHVSHMLVTVQRTHYVEPVRCIWIHKHNRWQNGYHVQVQLSTGICPLQAGLLQFSSVWCSWRSLKTSPVSPGCRCSIGLRGTSSRPLHPGSYNTLWLARLWCWFGSVLMALLPATSPSSAFLLPLLQVVGQPRRAYTASSQSPNHDLPAELRCRETISVEQSSCCCTEIRDDTAHFQQTTEGLSVPHLMCWRTEGTFTTARRCSGIFVMLLPDTKLQTYLLT